MIILFHVMNSRSWNFLIHACFSMVELNNDKSHRGKYHIFQCTIPTNVDEIQHS